MRKVKCVSPFGGAHHGLLVSGHAAPPGHPGPFRLPPHEGGWVDTPLGAIGFGEEVDAPEPPAFIADGVNFVNEAGGADECEAFGPGCWCGRHKPLSAPQSPAAPPPTERPAPAAARQGAASLTAPAASSARTPPVPQGM